MEIPPGLAARSAGSPGVARWQKFKQIQAALLMGRSKIADFGIGPCVPRVERIGLVERHNQTINNNPART